ncbi:uncharacterized protein G2W53_021378 [Senna tora]|uniref:Uncharacterized protein n=1 Tax=Senna tora TaxID=362788 RepID=A0A834WND0_9FABA|nr:uncharacterized protein G2W53_021378 [Senna tora]
MDPIANEKFWMCQKIEKISNTGKPLKLLHLSYKWFPALRN